MRNDDVLIPSAAQIFVIEDDGSLVPLEDSLKMHWLPVGFMEASDASAPAVDPERVRWSL